MRSTSALLLIALATAAAALQPGCSRQKEGERCSLTNGDLDCEGAGDALFCTPASSLRGGDDGVDRCCPKEGDSISDDRCIRFLGGGTGGDSGIGGAGGDDGMGGDDGAGAQGNEGEACNYNSDCVDPLVCGPQGRCQPECIEDRDCPDGQSCVGDSGSQRCE